MEKGYSSGGVCPFHGGRATSTDLMVGRAPAARLFCAREPCGVSGITPTRGGPRRLAGTPLPIVVRSFVPTRSVTTVGSFALCPLRGVGGASLLASGVGTHPWGVLHSTGLPRVTPPPGLTDTTEGPFFREVGGPLRCVQDTTAPPPFHGGGAVVRIRGEVSAPPAVRADPHRTGAPGSGAPPRSPHHAGR